MAELGLEAPLFTRLGKAIAKKLEDGGLTTVGDLLSYAPRRYYSWGTLTDIGDLRVGEDATVLAQVVNQNLVRNRSGKGVRLLVDITDGQGRLTCTFFAKNPYMLSHHQRLLKPGETVLFGGKVSEYRGKKQMVQPEFEELEEASPELVARRAGRPIPVYSSVSGLPSWKISAAVSTVLDELDQSSFLEPLPQDVRSQHGLLTMAEAYRKLHQPETSVDYEGALRTLSWAEALALQVFLLAPRFQRLAQDEALSVPLALSADATDLVASLEEGLPFDLTEGQKEAWEQIESDLEKDEPMQRLLQADVGAGKTVVALLAMVKAVQAGYQSALLAPTEVLARQHYRSLAQMLDRAGITVPLHLLTGKLSAAEKEKALIPLAAGEPGIVVGTHALLQEDVQLPRLGLLVVDEQHRFGVAQREHLREGLEQVPHLLVMTATPIPRTIAMTVFGDLDVTAMKGLPPGRKEVQTTLVDARNEAWMHRIWQRVVEEVNSGGRVYVVCPSIDAAEVEKEAKGDGVVDGEDGNGTTAKIPSVRDVAKELRNNQQLAGIGVGVAHGQAAGDENAAAFREFQDGTTPILVATTVIEVGVDVPEASMIVVLGADRFGLSQLHQLRGRVGRSQRQSICLLVSHPSQNPITQQRLQAISATTDGFVLAETDLRLRREGDVLGQSQSGFRSGLKFLSVLRDGGIITAARDKAQTILEDDPTLTDHPDLSRWVGNLEGDEVIWLERN